MRAPVLMAGTYVGRDPREIDFSADEGNIVTSLTWTNWSSGGAVGVGRSDADTCVPNCAVAPIELEATTVTLSSPSDGHFSVITEERGGRTERFTYPSVWPVGATRSTPTPTPTSTPTPTRTASPPASSASSATTPAGATGSAVLEFSGAVSGKLGDAVVRCQPRSAGESTISVSGTLNGTPWLLSVASFDGQSGVWWVCTGPLSTGSGSVAPGYGAVATYPAAVAGVTAVDWSRGLTLDVGLTSSPGQSPSGRVTVRGTLTCP